MAVLNTGYACNNRCVFCDQGDLRSQVAQPAIHELRARLAALRARSETLVLSGGEVTIRPDFPELLAGAVQLGFRRIEIQTNGRMLAAPDFARTAVQAGGGVAVFTVALHGDTAEAHDHHTAARGSFAQAMRGIINLRSLGAPVWVTTVVTRSNFRTAPALAEATAALEVARHKWSFPAPAGLAERSFLSVIPRYALAAPLVAGAVSIGRRAGVDARIKGGPPCVFPPEVRPFVDPQGPQALPPLAGEHLPTAPRAHVKPCESCAARPACPGPSQRYTEEYGWSELAPLTYDRPMTEAAG